MSEAVIDTVVEAHRRCRELDVLVSVATPSAPARRLLQARTGGRDDHGARLVIHARVDTAITTSDAAA
ncbi:hypothetical protein [Streptomyces mangrovisoli]|uniref:hypothetical protein n=1 Tax=Streptomyces mangrovisoli TaxID=1428628 RepID=UPI000696E52D|nr:hypothetical protein [Streptomyces mangrovisoli]